MSAKTSTAQLAANRANAQLSTGPTSPEGKAKISLNAVKTGLTGRTILLPTDDVAAYEALIAEFTGKWQPATPEEQRFTQALADTEWRLMRVPELESGILTLGHRELAGDFSDIEDADARRSAINAKVWITHLRQLRNLQTQEARLRRQREKDTAALQQLQSERRSEAKRRLQQAAEHYIKAVEAETNEDWTPEQFGFEFSIDEIEARALEIEPSLFDAWYARNPEELAA